MATTYQIQLATAVAQYYNSASVDGDVKFTSGDSDFLLTAGVIYSSVDGELSPGSKSVKTINQVNKFVSLRA